MKRAVRFGRGRRNPFSADGSRAPKDVSVTIKEDDCASETSPGRVSFRRFFYSPVLLALGLNLCENKNIYFSFFVFLPFGKGGFLHMSTIDRILAGLNPQQKEAVLTTEGPVLILAGAGSGKTKVLTQRIAYLTGEKHTPPWSILAITFTNKAAREMQNRVGAIVGRGAEDIWISTFHSLCVRILRRDSERLGINRNFSILDAGDQLSVIK